MATCRECFVERRERLQSEGKLALQNTHLFKKYGITRAQCHSCNARLGIIENYREFSCRAIEYLAKHGKRVLAEAS